MYRELPRASVQGTVLTVLCASLLQKAQEAGTVNAPSQLPSPSPHTQMRKPRLREVVQAAQGQDLRLRLSIPRARAHNYCGIRS